jgi:hypothetical protein
MSGSDIGIQQIMPATGTGTGWQGANSQPEHNDTSDDESGERRKSERAPAAPGTGQIIDKIA